MAGREARHPEAPVLAKAAHRRGCRDWADPRLRADVQRCRRWLTAPLACFIGDGAYDQTGIYNTIAKRNPDADVIIPPRSTAVLTETAESTPTQRDRHLQSIAEHGRIGGQKTSGYTRRTLVES